MHKQPAVKIPAIHFLDKTQRENIWHMMNKGYWQLGMTVILRMAIMLRMTVMLRMMTMLRMTIMLRMTNRFEAQQGKHLTSHKQAQTVKKRTDSFLTEFIFGKGPSSLLLFAVQI